MASSSTSAVPSDASDVADPLTSQFQALMQRACSLLHHLDRQLNWDAAAAFDSNTHHNKASPGGAVVASNEATHFDNAACSNGNYVEGDEDMQSDSSDDDGMMLFGGGLLDSDSDNDDEPMGCDAPSSLKSEHQEECYEDENNDEGGEEEDDATMLQRASSVHVALLTSLSMASLSLQKSSSHHPKGGRRELVQALVSYILSSKSPSSNSGGDECKKTNKNMAVSDRWISCVCGAYVKMDRYGNDNKCSSGSFCRS